MQDRRRFLPLILGFFSVLLPWFCGSLNAAEKPNLIAIVTDDQGQWAMGAYGNKDIHSPNMDRIAQEGALFLNAFVTTPVCSPSRATYMSGRYPSELGINDWISPQEASEGLGLEGQTWPAVLQQHGYTTGMIGKWHLGELEPHQPKHLGFDYFMGFLAGGTRPMNAELQRNGEFFKSEGALPDRLTDEALRFLDENQKKPFSLCLHFRAPHLPYGPVPEEDTAHYKDLDPEIPHGPGMDLEKLKRTTIDYYASISSVDRNIGRVLDKLEALDLTENTIVLFTSDHGYNEGRHNIKTKGNGNWMSGGVNGPKRPNMFDTSMRVPLAIRWPARVEPGMQITEDVVQIDMFRTVLGMLDLPLPNNCQAHGIDFSPLLEKGTIPQREAIFGQYDLHNGGLAYMRMIRTPRYKLIKQFNAKMMDELYDLQADPGETKNLIRRNAKQSDQVQKVHQRLEEQLTKWQQSINDPILNDRY
ncbi:N-acetylgalactosamine 6-sulfate sulfatase [Planctomycetales bacterium 10988]|nr:N-acetylgalactosamine 6-sulfate sulfatase [Planctomycetales bacterium 10988]